LKTTKAQREYAVLSLATTASWKDKNGDGYIQRTEWHKLVAWGNLSLFAATLKKGAHVSVEGELRYREFVPKKQKNGYHKIRSPKFISRKSRSSTAPRSAIPMRQCPNSGQSLAADPPSVLDRPSRGAWTRAIPCRTP